MNDFPKNDSPARPARLLDEFSRNTLASQVAEWESGEVASFVARQPESRDDYHTESGLPLQRTYSALVPSTGIFHAVRDPTLSPKCAACASVRRGCDWLRACHTC